MALENKLHLRAMASNLLAMASPLRAINPGLSPTLKVVGDVKDDRTQLVTKGIATRSKDATRAY